MPSSASTRLRVELQALGENLNSWGDTRLNEALKRLEESICGVSNITVTGNVILTSSNYVTDQARMNILNLTGSPTSGFTVTAPAVEKRYLVRNATGQAATFTQGSGTTCVVRAGTIIDVFCDATNFYAADLTLDQINTASAAISVGGFNIQNVADPVNAQDAATKHWVENPVANRPMGGYKITVLGTPVASSDAATKGYVDNVAFSGVLSAGSVAGTVPYYTGSMTNWTNIALLNAAGTAVNLAVLGTGTPSQYTFLRGDGAWINNATPDYLLFAQGII